MPSLGDDFPLELIRQAAHILIDHQQATISLLQRRLKMGYSRARCLMERLEVEGVVTAPDETGQRGLIACRLKPYLPDACNKPREVAVDIKNVLDIFRKEFDVIADKFCVYDIALAEAASSTAEHVWKPGVYVFWKPAQVVKVGRHLTNARKRALEHIVANTGGSMAALADDPNARLILFSLKDPDDKHWAASVEIFLERQLEPLVKAGRLG